MMITTNMMMTMMMRIMRFRQWRMTSNQLKSPGRSALLLPSLNALLYNILHCLHCTALHCTAPQPTMQCFTLFALFALHCMYIVQVMLFALKITALLFPLDRLLYSALCKTAVNCAVRCTVRLNMTLHCATRHDIFSLHIAQTNQAWQRNQPPQWTKQTVYFALKMPNWPNQKKHKIQSSFLLSIDLFAFFTFKTHPLNLE